MREQLQEIRVFQNHPFQVKDDDSMQALCDSIREYGVLSPLLARPTGEGYEIVSGHRRRAAAMKLGLEKLPVLVRDWGELISDNVIATALLDRLLHHAHVINIRGQTYRLKDRLKAGIRTAPPAEIPAEQ